MIQTRRKDNQTQKANKKYSEFGINRQWIAHKIGIIRSRNNSRIICFSYLCFDWKCFLLCCFFKKSDKTHMCTQARIIQLSELSSRRFIPNSLYSADYCQKRSVYSFFGVFSIFMSVRLIKIEKSESWYLKLPIACFYTFRAKKNWFFLWKFEVRTDFPKKKFTPKKEWANSKIFEWDLSFWNHFKTCQNWCQLH